MEKWITGYENKYSINNLGEVFAHNFHRQTIKVKMKHKTTNGYCRIGLRLNKKQTFYSIHRLVAEAFIENPNNFPQVNHIDGNKQNNYVENLEWVTQSENMIHAYSTGLIKNTYRNNKGTRNPRCILSDDIVSEIRKIGKNDTYLNISKKYNVSKSCIYSILNNRNWRN